MVDIAVSNNKVSKPNVGIITPPDEKVSSTPYNSAEATKRFNALNRDIYQAQQSVKSENAKFTSKGLLMSIAIVAGGVLLLKTKVITKLISLFKKQAPAVLNK